MIVNLFALQICTNTYKNALYLEWFCLCLVKYKGRFSLLSLKVLHQRFLLPVELLRGSRAFGQVDVRLFRELDGWGRGAKHLGPFLLFPQG